MKLIVFIWVWMKWKSTWHLLFASIVRSDKHSSDIEKSYTDTQVTQVTKKGQVSFLCYMRRSAHCGEEQQSRGTELSASESSGVPRGRASNHPPPRPKFRGPSKILPKSTRLWKLLKIAEFRKSTLQDVKKKGSKIMKLPPVRNCFTLAMTNKLVVINSLKVPKIIENVTIWNEISCTKLQLPPEPLTRGLPPPDPFSLCPQLNLLNSPASRNKIPGYATVWEWWSRHWDLCLMPRGVISVS